MPMTSEAAFPNADAIIEYSSYVSYFCSGVLCVGGLSYYVYWSLSLILYVRTTTYCVQHVLPKLTSGFEYFAARKDQ